MLAKKRRSRRGPESSFVRPIVVLSILRIHLLIVLNMVLYLSMFFSCTSEGPFCLFVVPVRIEKGRFLLGESSRSMFQRNSKQVCFPTSIRVYNLDLDAPALPRHARFEGFKGLFQWERVRYKFISTRKYAIVQKANDGGPCLLITERGDYAVER